MKSSDVITLDDNREYVLVDDYEYADKKYFLAIGLLNNGDYNKDDVKFFLDVSENGEEWVEEEDNPETIKALTYLVGLDVAMDADPNAGDQIDAILEKYQEGGSV